MSILIKGMDMPKSCSECKFRYIAIGLDFQCAISGETVDNFYETRHPNCALVAISTPHGRLIDACKLYEPMERNLYAGIGCDPTNIAAITIYEAPTIIEAEANE